jgi:hypothetical protein
MAALSTWVENLIMNALLRNQSFTPPSQWFLALYLSNPTAADSGTEVTGTYYERQPIIFGAPSNGVVTSTAEVTFPMAGTNWGNITHAAIRDASTSGHLLFYGGLSTPRYISNGDVLKFLAGNVSCTIS